jgi:hypothetical protein
MEFLSVSLINKERLPGLLINKKLRKDSGIFGGPWIDPLKTLVLISDN